jgi:preprotein translocase subunit SecD
MKKPALFLSVLLNVVLVGVSVNLWLDLRTSTLGLDSKWVAAKSVLGAWTLPSVRIEFRIADSEPRPGLTAMRNAEYGETLYVRPEVALGNSDIRTVIATKDEAGQPAIDIIFTDNGVKKMQELSGANAGKRLAVLVDGTLLFAPYIMGPISDRHAVVTGALDSQKVQRIVLAFARRH